jgi:hypothetical protein
MVDARRIELDDARWSILRTEGNVLVLDRPEYRVGAGGWQGPEEVLRVDTAVRMGLGIPLRNSDMVQPWARKRTRAAKGRPVTLRYRFTVDAPVTGEMSLALESPCLWGISLNGQAVDPDTDCGWWVDPSLRKLPLDTSVIRHGENELVLSGSYDAAHPGLEIVYLLGDFGVEVNGTRVSIINAPRSLALGDWATQGLPFYAGSVCYCRTVTVERGAADRVILQCSDYKGIAVRVLVDGVPAGVIAWEPNEVDITRFVPEGQSSPEIRVEVAGHRRNSHGPLHHASKWPAWTGPWQYLTTGSEWMEGYQLVPCGLMKPPAIVVRRPG